MESISSFREKNMRELSKVRLLDVDDLIIISLLSSDYTKSEIAELLALTPPAISHRMKKYRIALGENSVKSGISTGRKSRKPGEWVLTPRGETVVTYLTQALMRIRQAALVV